jgi:hypothetical protein
LSRILEEYLPKFTTTACSLIIILVVVDTYISGGLNLGMLIGSTNPTLRNISVTRLIAVNTRAVAIVTMVMTYALVQLYFRRLRSDDRSMQRKGIFFMVGLALMLAAGLIFGPLAPTYSMLAVMVQQVVLEGGSYWIGITFTALMVRGYMVRSKEGIIMAAAGLLELYGQGNLGSFFLPQLGDAGIWVMRYPALGVNNAMWLATYIGLITICGRIIIGRQKLRAAR